MAAKLSENYSTFPLQSLGDTKGIFLQLFMRTLMRMPKWTSDVHFFELMDILLEIIPLQVIDVTIGYCRSRGENNHAPRAGFTLSQAYAPAWHSLNRT